MDRPRLILPDGEEAQIETNLVSIGRTPDNDISLPDDTNVSRYHAEIEERDGEFWLIDLQSSNGTTLNGDELTAEKPLSEGDQIVLGGSSELTFTFQVSDAEPEEEDQEQEEKEDTPIDDGEEKESAEPAGGGQSRKVTMLLVFASLAIGLGVILAVVAGLVFFTGGGLAASSACNAGSEIVAPENGDILAEASKVEIDVDDTSCVSEAVFLVGGKVFGRDNQEPFEADLDPSRFPGMSDGRDRKITVILIDDDGNEIPQSTEIAISLETIEAETPEPTQIPEGGTGPDGQQTVPTPTPALASLIDTQKMAGTVIPQFSGNLQYNTNNPRFLEEVAKMTTEYRSEGFFDRAARYRDVINYQYLREQNLDPPLGYILAMSRTKFEPTNRADGAGLWKMNNQLVLDNAYNGICGAETIASETQKCAAIASSSYLKDLILNVFNGDVIYGVAAFGMEKQQAAIWNESLPNDPRVRSDFWNVIRDPGRREQVVRFFAAAIVAENPKRFGLDKDQPISNLYPATVE